MRTALLEILALMPLLAAPHRSDTKQPKEYRFKDGNRVVISPIRKWTKDRDYTSHESRLDFYSPDNELLCALDYSSEDHEHGFGVVKAAWTPDNDYFVYSLTSSGGHQAWHAPTLFYSVRDHEIRSLDRYVAAAGIGISRADFTLRPPNTVVTEIQGQGEEQIPIKFRLDSLANSGRKSKYSMSCTGGKVIHPNA